MRRALAAAGVLVLLGCGAGAPPPPATLPPVPTPPDGRAATSALTRAEDEVLAWLAAADPRLAARTGVTASPEMVAAIGNEAVMAEDATAILVGSTLDLFAFRARAVTLARAQAALAKTDAALPEVGPLGSGVARPRLERELLGRLVDEELARTADEAKLGDAAGDLVRAMVATWTPPSTPQDVPARDAWATKHLLEIRDSLGNERPLSGPLDLEQDLYPLERLLAPLQYPKATAALARLRITVDEDGRPRPKLDSGERVARAVKEHLGLSVDAGALPARLEAIAASLQALVAPKLSALDVAARAQALGKARALLFALGPCPQVADSRVRSLPPPPERAAVCGALQALADEATRLAALVALHDDVLLAAASVTASPPPRTRLLSGPADDDVDGLRRLAQERPSVVLGPALAAEVLLAGGSVDARIDAWRALGEVPLDVLSRELPGR